MPRSITTYSMPAESERLGFAIRDHSRSTRTEQPHRHEFFQMRLDVGGETHHNIGPHRRRLARGSLTFVLPYRMHRGGRHADSQFYVINFHHRFLRPEMNLDPFCLDAVPLERAPELAPFLAQELIDFQLEGNALERAHEACRQMLEQSANHRFFSVELIRAHLLLLLGLACQRYEGELMRFAASGINRSVRNTTLGGMSRYISARLAERISLADVARAVEMSPNNVTRFLKRETGKTFMQFLTERRLQRAQELLANTSLRIADVANAVGFDDNAYFARRFRQLARMSPRTYRNVTVCEARLNSPT